jgi:hypothetical protein
VMRIPLMLRIQSILILGFVSCGARVADQQFTPVDVGFRKLDIQLGDSLDAVRSKFGWLTPDPNGLHSEFIDMPERLSAYYRRIQDFMWSLNPIRFSGYDGTIDSFILLSFLDKRLVSISVRYGFGKGMFAIDLIDSLIGNAMLAEHVKSSVGDSKVETSDGLCTYQFKLDTSRSRASMRYDLEYTWFIDQKKQLGGS